MSTASIGDLIYRRNYFLEQIAFHCLLSTQRLRLINGRRLLYVLASHGKLCQRESYASLQSTTTSIEVICIALSQLRRSFASRFHHRKRRKKEKNQKSISHQAHAALSDQHTNVTQWLDEYTCEANMKIPAFRAALSSLRQVSYVHSLIFWDTQTHLLHKIRIWEMNEKEKSA